MKDRVREERKFWDSYAKKYDNFIAKRVSGSYNRLFQKLRKDAKNCPNLLEIGTGTGILSFELSGIVSNITAIDISPEMIAVARSKAVQGHGANIDFRVGDSCALEFENGSFDMVIASNILHLLHDPELALTEIKRVLKEDGQAILPTYCHGENIKSLLISRFMGLFGFRARNRWSTESFKKFVDKNGWIINDSEVFKDKIPLMYIRASKNKIT